MHLRFVWRSPFYSLDVVDFGISWDVCVVELEIGEMLKSEEFTLHDAMSAMEVKSQCVLLFFGAVCSLL
jgi:hypothetical protein